MENGEEKQPYVSLRKNLKYGHKAVIYGTSQAGVLAVWSPNLGY